MAIVPGQGGAEDDKVKGIVAQGVLNFLAVEDSGHAMSGLAHCGSLGGESGFVGLGVENLDGGLLSGFLSSRGQGPSWNSLRA